MSISLDAQKLKLVFGSRPDIIEGIGRAADSPGRVALFNEIATHVYDHLQASDEPAQKRRKVDNDAGSGEAAAAAKATAMGNAADEPVLLEVKEISVSVPQRKKFELCFTENYIYARAPGTTAPVSNIVHAWTDIEYIFYLPVPEKTQVQHNYILFPRGSSLPSKNSEASSPEPLVFTIPATAPKQGTIGGSEAGSASAVSDTYKALFHWAIGTRLQAVGSPVTITSANPGKFHSVIRQAHRPNEKAVHVGGYRGSKDGFLFFLENGILWGYKKPLIFIPLSRISAISYTSILQVTFNIVVEVLTGSDGGSDDTEEFEFGMIDQQDYGGIDCYIKDNRLQDRSMAEQRKAKLQLAENKAKKGEAADRDGAPEDDTTELERAQQEVDQQMQGADEDEEEEDEEDYDPGSDGESEGSGDSSGDDDDDDDDAEGEDGEDEEDEEEEEGREQVKKEEEDAAPVKSGGVPVRQGWASLSNS